MIAMTTPRRVAMALPDRYRDWAWFNQFLESKGIPPDARITIGDDRVVNFEWEMES